MKVICFGEIMLRLSPPGFGRFVQASSFDAYYGGGEANVAVSLAEFGEESSFVTRLPAHELGQAAVNELRRFGVDTSYIARGGDRIGIYYCEKGASQRSSKVIYDRAGSAVSQAKPGDFDWDEIFYSADWFHFTGITPALSEGLAAICAEACAAAKKRGITVSCDLNYRRALWTPEKAGGVMTELLNQTGICVINEEHARLLFGIKPDSAEQSDEIRFDACTQIARRVAERFGCFKVAVTLRRSLSASDNLWAAVLYDHQTDCVYNSRVYNLHIIDRVGGGDAFCAGLIRSLRSGASDAEAVEFAAAACALKHTIEGDSNHVTVGEVQALAAGGSGRIAR